jgi:hypothetical protein
MIPINLLKISSKLINGLNAVLFQRIVAAPAPWMTSGNAFGSQPYAFENAILLMASSAYCEQVGVYRHALGSMGEIIYL